jgi:hypothetical protein
LDQIAYRFSRLNPIVLFEDGDQSYRDLRQIGADCEDLAGGAFLLKAMPRCPEVLKASLDFKVQILFWDEAA